LFTGIYATDTAQLSMAAVLPRMLEMERQYGSLTAAMLRSFSRRSPAVTTTKPKPRGFTLSFSNGLEMLPVRLAEKLAVRYEQTEARIGLAPVTVLAVPAYAAAGMLNQQHSALASLLGNIRYSPVIVAATSLAEHDLAEPLKGFGFLVPRSEQLHLLGTIFSSALFPGRAPEGRVLLTSFIGGSFEPEVLKWSDDQIWETVCSELKQVLKAEAMPEPIGLRRHQNALPQYNIGHERLVASLKSELQQTSGLFVASNYLEGASLPACIEQAERTAHQIASYLRKTS
jgi:oxygen-dependent protoporphyrinogen oxidase